MRFKLAFVLLVAFAVLVHVRLAARFAADEQVHAEPGVGVVGAYEARYAALRQRLPERGAVGYISDVTPYVFAGPGKTAFFHAQYALAPVVVALSDEQELVVGNFLRADTDPRRYAKSGLILVEDFGNGVALFRRISEAG